MADLYVEWNDDLQLSASGDLLLADQDDLARQRIIRRLLTPLRGYIYHQEYGAGLPRKIGESPSATRILAIVRSQMMMESVVSITDPIQVSVETSTNNPSLYVVGITYKSKSSGQTISFSIMV